MKELEQLMGLSHEAHSLFRVHTLAQVEDGPESLPILSFVIGSEDVTKPTFGIFGGVHGLERVGTHIVMHFLSNLKVRLDWDQELAELLQHFRIVSLPLVNPAGMKHLKRANMNGVDIMRNSPVECEKPFWPVSGQKVTKHFPWYRGNPNKPELETQTIRDFVEREMLQSEVSIALDIHSGFGMKDRLWYPYAKTPVDFPFKEEVGEIHRLLNRTLPHHIYTLESQCDAYPISGDLWDYLFDRSRELNPAGVFIPFTLELGSWLWVKKNPRQFFSFLGLFNPLKQHRFERVMRRHLLLIDFLIQVTKNKKSWQVSKLLESSHE